MTMLDDGSSELLEPFIFILSDDIIFVSACDARNPTKIGSVQYFQSSRIRTWILLFII